MTKTFTAHLLCANGASAPVFSSCPASISPDEGMTLQTASGKILLGGGFPSFTPETGFPLSPTLQLNADLGLYLHEKLQEIGRAELDRRNAVQFHSYSIEADTKVAAATVDPARLRVFIDTYGGILDIIPLLLKGYHQDFTTAEELTIESGPDGCLLSYLVRKPVDRQKCTYCAACGPVCPEKCLSETLWIDLSRCTCCQECVTVCPQGAIDLHAAERRELAVPALILLDDASPIEPAEKAEHIFTSPTQTAYFSSLFPSRIDEVVSVDNSICQYSARLQAGCSRCVSVCRQDAIRRTGNGIEIDHLRCVECGACVSVCPTGAIQHLGFRDSRFVEYFRTFTLGPGTVAVIGNEQALHRFWWNQHGNRFGNVFFLEHPRLHALSAMQLIYLFAVGAGKVVLLDNEDISEQSPLFGQLEMVNRTLETLFCVNRSLFTATPDTLLLHLGQSPPLSSGGFRLPAKFVSRRDTLAAILKQFTEESGKTVCLAGEGFNSFGTLSCDETRCTQCLACLNACRIRSLYADEANYSLNQQSSRCVQCGICVQVCPEDALNLVPGLPLEPPFFTSRELSRGEPIKCLECGKIFGTKKSFERVMAMLAAKNMLRDSSDFYQCCGNCRVVKLYHQAEKKNTHAQ